MPRSHFMVASAANCGQPLASSRSGWRSCCRPMRDALLEAISEVAYSNSSKAQACHDGTGFCIGGRDSNPSERAKDPRPSCPVAMLSAWCA
jgi:hypothetical protein